jgi:hypothetical protein
MKGRISHSASKLFIRAEMAAENTVSSDALRRLNPNALTNRADPGYSGISKPMANRTPQTGDMAPGEGNEKKDLSPTTACSHQVFGNSVLNMDER